MRVKKHKNSIYLYLLFFLLLLQEEGGKDGGFVARIDVVKDKVRDVSDGVFHCIFLGRNQGKEEATILRIVYDFFGLQSQKGGRK